MHVLHSVLGLNLGKRCSLLRGFRTCKPLRSGVDFGYRPSADAVGQAAQTVQHHSQVFRCRCDRLYIPLTFAVALLAPSLPFAFCDSRQASLPHKSNPVLAAKICQMFSPGELLDGVQTGMPAPLVIVLADRPVHHLTINAAFERSVRPRRG